MQITRASALVAAMVLLAASLGGCEDNAAQTNQAAAAPPPPPVTVSHPVTKVVADFDEYVGRFTPVDYVEIRARVSGYLEKIHFTDGQLVKADETLFTIDRRPYEVALEQAKASRAQAVANLDYADSDLKRGDQLVRGSTITQQTYDQRVQARHVAEAAVTAQDAIIKQAELNLEYTLLKSPIVGRIGDRRVANGNLVTGGSGGTTTLLATIVSIDPIRFEFTLDEQSYLHFLSAHGSTQDGSKPSAVEVTLKLIDEKEFTHKGKIDFVDNTIDRSSGTIRMRAEFPNPDGKLTPGMFGRIKVPNSEPASALLVPDTAIGTEQVRKFVYAIGADNVANPKYVKLGAEIDGMRIVTDGLKADDVIVVNGLMRIRPGTKVTPQQATAEATASTPSTKTN